MKRTRDILGRLLAAGMAAVLLAGSMPAGVYAEGMGEPEAVVNLTEGTEESEVSASVEQTDTEEKEEVTSDEYSSAEEVTGETTDPEEVQSSEEVTSEANTENTEEVLEESETAETSDSEELPMLGDSDSIKISGTIYASELTNADYLLDGDTEIIIREGDDVTVSRIGLVQATTQHNLTIKGSDKGKLTVTGDLSCGTGGSTGEDHTLKIEGGNIVCATIQAPDKLEIDGGNISTGRIKAAGDIEINGGYIDIFLRTINAVSQYDFPILANNSVYMKEGEVHCKYSYNSGKAAPSVVKADTVNISGGKLYLETDCSDGVWAYSNFQVSGYDTYVDIKVTGEGNAFRDTTITADGFGITDLDGNELHISDDKKQILNADGQPAKILNMKKRLEYGIATDKASGIDFPETSYGYAAPTQEITVTNTKSGPVTLMSIKLSSSSKFESKDFTETTIDPEETYTFTIKPKEYVAVGSYNETLTITTDRPDVTASVPLSYTVKPVVKNLQATPDSLDFGTCKRIYDGSYTVPVTGKKTSIKNIGTETVTLDTTVQHADYDVIYPADVELTPGESAEIMIRPKEGLAAGNHDSAFFVKTTTGVQTGVKIKLSVQTVKYSISADKSKLDFGIMSVGYQNSPAEKSVKIVNKGEADVTLKIPEFENYDISPEPGDVKLAPGKSVTLTVRPQLSLATGTYNQRLEIKTVEGPSVAVDISFEKGYYLSGYVNASELVDNANYLLTGDTTINLAPGDDKTIHQILQYDSDFNLTIQGSDSGKLKAEDCINLYDNEWDETEDVNCKLIIKGGALESTTIQSGGDIQIRGGKVSAGEITTYNGDLVISGGSISVDSHTGYSVRGKNVIITGGSLICKGSVIAISSIGAVILARNSISVSSAYVDVKNTDNNTSFESYALYAPHIMIGEDAFVTAASANSNEAICTDDLTVADGLKATDLVTGETVTLAATGAEHAGHLVNTSGKLVTSVRLEKNDMTTGLTLSTSEVDFGTMYEGFDVSPARKILVTNTGTAPVTLPAITSSAEPSCFTVGSYSDDILLPGQSACFTVQPKEDLNTDSSPYSETFSIDLTGAGGDKYTFTASVKVRTGLDGFGFDVTPKSLDFGTFPKGYKANGVPAQTVTITNTGNLPVEIDKDISKTKTEEPFVLDDLPAYSLAPGESMTATIRIADGTYTDDYFHYEDNIIRRNADISFKCGDRSFKSIIQLSFSIADPGEDSIWIEPIPAQTYNGTALKPAFNAYYRGVKLNAKDYTISYKNNTNAYTLTPDDADFNPAKAPSVTVKGKGNYTGTATAYFTIAPLDLGQATAADLLYAYTGKAQLGKTKVTYLLNGKTITLKENKDYTYEWESGKDYKAPGTYITKITAKPGSNYTGVKTYEETISAEDEILISTVKVPSIPEQKYTGKYKILTGMPVGDREEPVTAKNGNAFDFTLKSKAGKALRYGTDYTLSIDNNREIGTAVVTITGAGTYVGSRTVTFKITGTKLSSLKTEDFAKDVPYSGTGHLQPMRFYYVTGKGKSTVRHYLYEDVDYTAEYRDNTEIGTATVTYTGKGSYTGTVTKTYKITGTDMKKVSIPKNFAATTGKFGDIAYTNEQCYDAKKGYFIYTGGAFEVAGPACADGEASNYGIQLYAYDKKTDTKTYYRNGVDYIVTYKNNIEPGKATVTFTGIGRLSGSVSRTFNITPYNIKENKGDRITWVVLNDGPEYKYVKGGTRATCTVMYKGFNQESSSWIDIPLRDCTYEKKTSGFARSYNKFINMVSATNKKAAVIITGKGAFTGRLDPIEYTVNAADISNDTRITATDIVWQEKSGICKPVITITDRESGQVLKAGTDYQKTVKYTYKNATEVKVKGSTATVSRAAGDEVGAKDIVPKNTVITATVTGINNYSRTLSTDFRFIDKDLDLSKAVITIKSQVYTGKPIVLNGSDISFKIGGEDKTLELGSDYVIEYDKSGYKGIGTYKVTIRAKDDNEDGYGNSKTVSFKVTAKSFR